MAKQKPVYVESMTLPQALGIRHRKNPKEHDINSLIASFRRFGFTSPPMIDEATHVMVAGHGRCLALQRMHAAGETPPGGIELDDLGHWLVPIFRGISFANEQERDAYVVADNQHTIKGGWNVDALTELLESVQSAELGFEGLGFSDVDLKSFGLGDVELDDDQAGNGGDPKPEVNLPDRRVSLMFSSEQWDELKDTLNGKPTAEEVLRLVKLGKRSGVTPSSEAKGTIASVAAKARKK